MRDVVLPNFFPRRPLMDSNGRHTDWPCRIADRKAEVGVVSSLVGPGLHVVEDLGEVTDDVGWHVLRVSE